MVRPGGLVLIGFHVGEGSRLKTEGYGGHPMNVYVHRRTPARVSEWLREAGFTVEAELLVGPLSDQIGARETLVGAGLLSGAVLLGFYLAIPGMRDVDKAA